MISNCVAFTQKGQGQTYDHNWDDPVACVSGHVLVTVTVVIVGDSFRAHVADRHPVNSIPRLEASPTLWVLLSQD